MTKLKNCLLQKVKENKKEVNLYDERFLIGLIGVKVSNRNYLMSHSGE